MANTNTDWFTSGQNTPPWYSGPQSPPAAPPPPSPGTTLDAKPARRRTWPYIVAAAVVTLGTAGIVHHVHEEHEQKVRTMKAVAYKGRSGAALHLDSVDATATAYWSVRRDKVTVELSSYYDPDARYLHIDAGRKTATNVRKHGWYPLPVEITLPVTDSLADVTVRIAVGGKSWHAGSLGMVRTVRLSPTGTAYDAKSGKQLPSDL
ncbi:hypothetical protein GCM10023082_56850 [Streptomyces tremellae]|uniref:Tat pathway signal sequence domain protein n=2 Tax=Streptomyces tremellae TaxID=1124239 RepID=A0ABP7G1P1_9ACTN